MKVLVLGGDGFLGSHMVDRLMAADHEVTVFDRFPAGSPRNVGRDDSGLRLVKGELGDTRELRDALAGQELVYHFVSGTTPGSSWRDPMAEIEKNIRPTFEFLRLAAAAGVHRIAFASSGGTVYGARDGLLTEETPTLPVSPYGIGKLAIEGFLRHARETSGIAFDIYRIGNAYGPRQTAGGGLGVIAAWIDRIRKDEPIEVFGDGAVRDYIYAPDIAELMSFSLRGASESHLFNVGTGRGVSLRALLEIFRTVIPAPFDVLVHDRRPFDASSVILDGGKLLAHFPGFQFTAIEQGIIKTWESGGTALR